jgi:hypothetical protein
MAMTIQNNFLYCQSFGSFLPMAFRIGSTVLMATSVLGRSARGATAAIQRMVSFNGTCPSPYFSFSQPTICRPIPVTPYFETVDASKIAQAAKSSLAITPQYIHQFLHPGYSYSPDGITGYFLAENKEMISQRSLKKLYRTINQGIAINPEIKRQFVEKCGNLPADSKGCTVATQQNDGSMASILMHVAPKKMQNHVAAISALRSWSGNIERLSEQQIVDNLLKAHAILFQGMLKETDTEVRGYRTENSWVFRDQEDDQDRSIQGISQLILSRGGSQNDVKIFQNLIKKIAEASSNFAKADIASDMFATVTEREKKALSRVCYIPPSYQEVPKLMLEFAKQLKESILEMKRCNKRDPIALGAFVHRKIGEIHPFGDGNGRMARAFMNAILMEQGVSPVIFANDAEYTAAVERDYPHTGYFAEYLKKNAIPQMQAISSFLDNDAK